MIPWTWTNYGRTRPGHRAPHMPPVDTALSAQRRADRAQLDADRQACKAYPIIQPKESP